MRQVRRAGAIVGVSGPVDVLKGEHVPARGLIVPQKHVGRRRGELLVLGTWQLHPVDCPGPEHEVLPEKRRSDQLMQG